VSFQPVSLSDYSSHHDDESHARLPRYLDSSTCLQQIAARLPSMTSHIAPPSLTLQPPTSPPCVQSFEDDLQPPPLHSPSDILSQYGYNSSLSSPGVAWHYGQSPAANLSPQLSFQAAAAPISPCSIEQVSPLCYKRHLSLPTSPSQPIVSKFNFLTPPLRSPAAAHRSTSPVAFPLPPRAVSPVPIGTSRGFILPRFHFHRVLQQITGRVYIYIGQLRCTVDIARLVKKGAKLILRFSINPTTGSGECCNTPF